MEGVPRGRVLGLVPVLLAACADPSIDGEVVLRGRHLVVHADPALPVCDESVADADTYLESVAAFLELPVPETPYYLYDQESVSCQLVGHAAVGCTDGQTVRATRWIEHHELVHLVSDPWGRPPALLNEGLAEGLGTEYPQLSPAERAAAPIDDALDSVAFFSGSHEHVVGNYAVAADFTVYLLRRFGVPRYRRLYGSLFYLADRITIRRAFADAFGVGFDDLVRDWRAQASDADALPWLPHRSARCAAPLVAPRGPDDFAQSEPVCPSGLGDGGAILRQPATHTLDVATAGLFAVQSETSGLSVLTTISGCGTGDADLEAITSTFPATFLAPLATGRHALEVVGYVDLSTGTSPSAVSWSVSRIGVESGVCADAPLLAADEPPWVITVASPPAGWPGRDDDPEVGTVAVSWLRIDIAVSGRVYAVWQSPPDRAATRARVCQGSCDAPVACTDILGTRGSTPFEAIGGAPIFVEMRAPPGIEQLQLEIISP